MKLLVLTLVSLNALTLVVLILNLVGRASVQKSLIRNVSAALDAQLVESYVYLQTRAELNQTLQNMYIPVPPVDCGQSNIPEVQNLTAAIPLWFDSSINITFTAVETDLLNLSQSMNFSGTKYTYGSGIFNLSGVTPLNYSLSSIVIGGGEIFYIFIPMNLDNFWQNANQTASEVSFDNLPLYPNTTYGFDGVFDAQQTKVASSPANANFQIRLYTNNTLYFAQGTLLPNNFVGIRFNITMPIATI